MNNISQIHNCYGCGVCATVCSKKIIKIVQNKEGFYEPRITAPEKCTNCGLCTEVCAFTKNETANTPIDIKGYAAWSKAVPIRHKSSSGGVAFEICRTMIEKGYKVCSVQYNATKNIAEHYIATTPEELIPSMGSKYIQSYTVDAFKAINRKEKHIVVGTPCQIDSFRRYIQRFKVEENFILIDFFCHGIPSYLIWEKYTKEVEKQVGKITSAVWRHKRDGWHDSWCISIDGTKEKGNTTTNIAHNLKIEETIGAHFSKKSKGDSFYSLFLGNRCLGRACYRNCKYKYMSSSADIRLGDLWGNKYENDKEGVSSLFSFTQKGEEVIRATKDIETIEESISIAAEGQMQHKLQYPTIARPILLLMARTKLSTKYMSLATRFFAKLNRVFKI